jgi:hypothetical protein
VSELDQMYFYLYSLDQIWTFNLVYTYVIRGLVFLLIMCFHTSQGSEVAEDCAVPAGHVCHRRSRYVCMYVCVYVCIYVCMYVCVCVYVCMYVCMYMYACMHMYVYVCI